MSKFDSMENVIEKMSQNGANPFDYLATANVRHETMDDETQQRIDMMQMKIDELEAKVLEQMVAFTTAMKLIADLMEQRHGGK